VHGAQVLVLLQRVSSAQSVPGVQATSGGGAPSSVDSPASEDASVASLTRESTTALSAFESVRVPESSTLEDEPLSAFAHPIDAPTAPTAPITIHFARIRLHMVTIKAGGAPVQAYHVRCSCFDASRDDETMARCTSSASTPSSVHFA
jgi:hypothetical protein